MKYIDEIHLHNKRILLRLDLNVSLKPNHTIADDARIKQSLPTIQYLLENNNKLILTSHLGRPKGRDDAYSLRPVVKRLHEYLPHYTFTLIKDFSLPEERKILDNQSENQVFVLENIRFYPQEQENDQEFAKALASLADVYVNDAFGVCHRKDASVVGITNYLPSFGGLLLKKEVETIRRALAHPRRPFVTILGGSKISTKIKLIKKLMDISDYLLIGGGLANNFLTAKHLEIGKSITEPGEITHAQHLLAYGRRTNTQVLLPEDVVIGNPHNLDGETIKKVDELDKNDVILDIGPETQAAFGTAIAKAKTIIWNGPVGYFENLTFRRGSDFIYYTITDNTDATSIVGGGDTLAAISKQEYLEKITHISTGGGAMLEFIEYGTLPGIEALQKSHELSFHH